MALVAEYQEEVVNSGEQNSLPRHVEEGREHVNDKEKSEYKCITSVFRLYVLNVFFNGF